MISSEEILKLSETVINFCSASIRRPKISMQPDEPIKMISWVGKESFEIYLQSLRAYPSSRLPPTSHMLNQNIDMKMAFPRLCLWFSQKFEIALDDRKE
jgi:hypothetical protein